MAAKTKEEVLALAESTLAVAFDLSMAVRRLSFEDETDTAAVRAALRRLATMADVSAASIESGTRTLLRGDGRKVRVTVPDDERVTVDGEDLGTRGELEAQLKAAPARTVRVRESFGPCRVLGEFVRETDKSFVYRDSDGKAKTAKKEARSRYAGAARPRPHVEPCTCCKDHPNSSFADGRCQIHGSEHPCETCMST
jgi:RNase P/RNase MRP subunit p29